MFKKIGIPLNKGRVASLCHFYVAQFRHTPFIQNSQIFPRRDMHDNTHLYSSTQGVGNSRGISFDRTFWEEHLLITYSNSLCITPKVLDIYSNVEKNEVWATL